MTFEEAVKEIEKLFPVGSSFYMGYECQYQYGKFRDFSLRANVYPANWDGLKNNKSYVHTGSSWQEVIDKLKIDLVPKGAGNINEAPNFPDNEKVGPGL